MKMIMDKKGNPLQNCKIIKVNNENSSSKNNNRKETNNLSQKKNHLPKIKK